MTDRCCRACDGRGGRKTVDKENVFKERVTTCSACGGSGKTSAPPKDGARRGFRRAPKSEDDDNDLNAAGDTFLRRHGFNKHGR